MRTILNLKSAIENEKARSAWSKGVKMYALELLEDMDNETEFYGSPADRKTLLNGADNWAQYSEGGCSLIYNSDIAERVCNASELKETRNGERNPNGREDWLACQGRALSQAGRMIMRLSR